MNLTTPREMEQLGADLEKLANEKGLGLTYLERLSLRNGYQATIRLVSERLARENSSEAICGDSSPIPAPTIETQNKPERKDAI